MTKLRMRVVGIVVGALIAFSPVRATIPLVGDVDCGPAAIAAVAGYVAYTGDTSSADLSNERVLYTLCRQAGFWRAVFGVLVIGGAMLIALSLPAMSSEQLLEEQRRLAMMQRPPPPRPPPPPGI